MRNIWTAGQNVTEWKSSQFMFRSNQEWVAWLTLQHGCAQCAMNAWFYYYKMKKSKYFGKPWPSVEDNIKMGLMDMYVVWNHIAYDRDQWSGFVKIEIQNHISQKQRYCLRNQLTIGFSRKVYFFPLVVVCKIGTLYGSIEMGLINVMVKEKENMFNFPKSNSEDEGKSSHSPFV